MNERGPGCTEYIVIIAGALLICNAIYVLSRPIQAKLNIPTLAAIGLVVATIVGIFFVLVSIAVLLGNARSRQEASTKQADTVAPLDKQAQTIERPAEFQLSIQEAERGQEDEIPPRDTEKRSRLDLVPQEETRRKKARQKIIDATKDLDDQSILDLLAVMYGEMSTERCAFVAGEQIRELADTIWSADRRQLSQKALQARLFPEWVPYPCAIAIGQIRADYGPTLAEIGRTIRRARDSAGWTQKQIAQWMDWPTDHYGELERGIWRFYSRGDLSDVCDLLGLSDWRQVFPYHAAVEDVLKHSYAYVDETLEERLWAEMDNRFLSEQLDVALDALSPRIRHAILATCAYGFTLRETAKLMQQLYPDKGNSAGRIQQLTSRGLHWIRHPVRSRKLRDFLQE